MRPQPSGLDRLPSRATIAAVRAGLLRDLRRAERADARDGLGGTPAFTDAVRRALVRLDRIEALYRFLDGVAAVWPRAGWPAWPPEVAVLDVPLDQ